MVRFLALSLFLIMSSLSGFSQTTLNFCASVQDDYCFFNNTQFISPPDSAKALVFMLVRNSQGLGTDAIVYQIQRIDKTGKETLLKRIEQGVQSNWDYVWQSELFPTPGKYKIQVFTGLGMPLVEKQFELFLPR